MNKIQISVISVPVRDQDRAKEFYIEKLGFEEELDTFLGDEVRWVVLRLQGGGPAIMLVDWIKSMKPGSLKGLVLGVANIRDFIAHLRQVGVQTDDDLVQRGPWGQWVSLEDPDGNGWLVQEDPLLAEEAQLRRNT